MVSTVHLVFPDGVDDPARPSGGNVFDRRVGDGLVAAGWSVHEHAVPGSWPVPDERASAALAAAVATLPDGAVLLVDGLVGSAAPDVLVPESRRLRLVVLVHMPLGGMSPDSGEREAAVLSAAAAVVTTSGWTRRRLLESYTLDGDRVHVAPPGVDAADLAPGTAEGGGLLCVAAVTPGKGHDVLLAALAATRDLSWRLECVGALDHDPALPDRLRRQAEDAGIGGRVRLRGALVGAALDEAYGAADVLLLASHAETYGMVVTEALARGLPVLGTAVGGLPEALGSASDGSLPGVLVPRDDPPALADAVRRWLTEPDLRRRLRDAARDRRATLPPWSDTTERIAQVLAVVGAPGGRG